MVEMRNQEKNETPEIITVSMILEDLENGEDRNAIREKYGLQAWEVKQMFEHPSLKGKKAKKVRRLSFSFVDDTQNTNPDVLPGQVDLEDAIKEELEGRQMMDAQDQLQEVEESTDWEEVEADTIDQYNEKDY